VSRSLAIAMIALLPLAAPAGAADSCAQRLKDAQAAFKANGVGEKAVKEIDGLLKDAEAACTGGKESEAQDLLRRVRVMLGE